jgi:hypothetical protein
MARKISGLAGVRMRKEFTTVRELQDMVRAELDDDRSKYWFPLILYRALGGRCQWVT